MANAGVHTFKQYLQSFSPHQNVKVNGVIYHAWDLLNTLVQTNDARLALPLSEMANGTISLLNADGTLNTGSLLTSEEKHK